MYKFISKTEIEQAPKYINAGDTTIANPPKEMLLDMGYKEFIAQEYPPTDDGYYREPIYTDGETINQTWGDPIKMENENL